MFSNIYCLVRKVYLQSFPPTLEFSELTPTPTKMLTLFGVYAGVIRNPQGATESRIVEEFYPVSPLEKIRSVGIVTRLEAIALRLEAIANRLEA